MIPRRIGVIVATAVIVGIPVLTSLLVVAPLQHQAAADDASRASIESANSVQAARNGELKSSDARLTLLRGRAAALDAALPKKPEVAALLARIGAMSVSEGVTIVSFTSGGASAGASPAAGSTPAATPTPAPAASSAPASGVPSAAEPSGVSEVPVDVQVSGTLNAVRDFVGALQGGTRIIGVRSVSISQDSTGTFTGDIAGSAYVLPVASTAAPVG